MITAPAAVQKRFGDLCLPSCCPIGINGGTEKLISILTATLMAIRRPGRRD